MPSMRIDVMTAKKVAPPLPFAEWFDTITQPLASAKSAIDQMKNQTAAMSDST